MLHNPHNNDSGYDNEFASDAVVNLNNDTNNINEEQWIKTLFLISDTQAWIEELQLNLMYQLPVKHKRKLFRKSYYLTATALAHILERHYFKIPRYPNAGKFIIPVTSIVAIIRDAATQPTLPITNSCNLQRVLDTKQVIGFDRFGKHTGIVTIVSDAGGKIITAFPGTINP